MDVSGLRLVVVAMVVGLAGCVRSSSVDCGGDAVCPAGTTCAPIGSSEGFACIGADPVCGNGRVEPFELVDGLAVASEQCDEGDTGGFDGCSPGCQLETPRWTELQFGVPMGPDGIAGHAMVYDLARHRFVLFGVNGRNETWESDGHGWVRVFTTTAPPIRLDPAMAYDAARHEVVLFGGSNGLDDTWTWDGVTWRQRVTPIAPSGRRGHAMAYDARREVVVLFGGAEGADDTWEWNGETWSQVVVDSPGPRSLHAMTYDPRRDRVVLAGGLATDGSMTLLQDSWTFDGTSWQPAGPLPEPKAGLSLAYDPTSSAVLAFGGDRPPSAPLGATWAWDGATWTELAPAISPISRDRTAMVTDPITEHVVLFGGVNGQDDTRSLADRWSWDGADWEEVKPTPVPGRLAYAASAYDTRRGTLVVFGGIDDAGVLQATTWELTGLTWRAVAPTSASPPALRDAAMVFDEARGRTLLFGGATTNAASPTLSGDTWSWDGTTWQLEPAGPPPRVATAMAYDFARDRVVLFGGRGAVNRREGDTWEWDGTGWARRADDPGLGRNGHTLAYDHRLGKVILFGGPVADLDVHAWDPATATWAVVATEASLGTKALQRTAWDGGRGALMVFGGGIAVDGGVSLDLCEWTTSCRDITPGGPVARVGHVMATTVDGVMMLGGAGVFAPVASANFDDAWLLRYVATGARYETCASGVDNDGDGLAGCADPDCWARCTPACAPGTCTTTVGCGDGTCNAALENCRNCPADCSCEPVCGDAICDPLEDCPGDCP